MAGARARPGRTLGGTFDVRAALFVAAAGLGLAPCWPRSRRCADWKIPDLGGAEAETCGPA